MSNVREDIFMGVVVLLFSIVVLIIPFIMPNSEYRTGYEETTGYLSGYNKNDSSKETSYTLIYSYVVDNNNYTVSSSSGKGARKRI